MIQIFAALLVGFPLQQPQSRPSPAPARPAPAATTPARTAAYDSSVAAIGDIGMKVGAVKSQLELFRRAVFNETNDMVLERSGTFRSSCLEMATAARRGQRILCRSCMARYVQAAVEQYRAYLPSLARVGDQCAATLQRLGERGSRDARTAALRREVRTVGNGIVLGLRPYEARLAVVREKFGWAPPASPAARPQSLGAARH